MYIFVYICVSYNLRSTRVKPTGFQTLTPSKFKGWYPPQGGRAFHFGKAWHDVAGSVRFNTNKTDTKIQPKISRRYPAVLHGSSIICRCPSLMWCIRWLWWWWCRGWGRGWLWDYGRMTTHDQFLTLLMMETRGNDFTGWFRMGYKSHRIWIV